MDPPPLGEAFDRRQQWSSGVQTGRVPLPVVIGEASCFADGAHWPPAAQDLRLTNGFDSRCPVAGTGLPPFQLLPGIVVRDDQLFHATVIEALYDSTAEAEAVILARLGPTWALRSVERSSDDALPRVTAASNGQQFYVWCEGTADPLQGAVQAANFLTGPSAGVGYGTFPLYDTAAGRINSLLQQLNVGDTAPVCFAGHSYGGAAVSVAAAWYKRHRPNRLIECLTFGSPNPGDRRLAALLDRVHMVRMRNTGDVVTALPPTLDVALLMVWPVNWLNPPPFFQWADPGRGWRLDAAGVLVESDEAVWSYGDMFKMLNWLILGGTVADTPPTHPITVYKNRLAL